ncbi:MAG: hypothetical protein JO212_05460 [Acetobacteraceae bacterium]|nr:hypothetical protein [Acetobacteraceae bacterium]
MPNIIAAAAPYHLIQYCLSNRAACACRAGQDCERMAILAGQNAVQFQGWPVSFGSTFLASMPQGTIGVWEAAQRACRYAAQRLSRLAVLRFSLSRRRLLTTGLCSGRELGPVRLRFFGPCGGIVRLVQLRSSPASS